MHTVKVILVVLALAPVAYFLAGFVLSLLIPRRRLTTEDPRHGLAVFVEGVRWLGVCWDWEANRQGLARAGFAGQSQYWQWHGTGQACLVLPVIRGRELIEREARRLAEFVTQQSVERPGRPIILIGHSCGAYLVLRALELLPEGVQVESVALLAGAFSPRLDLTAARRHIRGRLVVMSSAGDFFLLGLGTLISGTPDGRHAPAAGMVGVRTAVDDRLVQIHWRPAMLATGHIGGHFSTPAFIARYIAPHLLDEMRGRDARDT